MARPTKEQFEKIMTAKFQKYNPYSSIPEAWMSWLYDSFRIGYEKGQDDFSREHDWFE